MINRSRRNSKKAFTFLEIMFVVVIIGILLALVGPRLVGRTQKARIQASKAQLKSLETAIKTFEMDTGTFPERLEDLIDRPSELEESWDGPYVDSDVVPTDAWNEDYEYEYPGDENENGFDLWSKGPDRESNTEDDIPNWTKGR